MNQEAIFNPLGALVALTFLVLLQIPIRRFRARFAGRVTVDDFKLGESSNVPADVSIPNRNLMNLLEMPLVFYVGAVVFYLTKKVDQTALVLAWTYVGLRTIHSAIHLTYNRVVHRLTVFAVSNFVLAAMWVRWFFVR
jgi:hypothetical protein